MTGDTPAPPIPLAVEDVDRAWVDAALRHGGHDVEVTAVAHGEVTGGNATKIRVRATYAGATDLPADLFVKVGMELQDPSKNLTGSTYDVEGRFFLDVLHRVDGLDAPRCLAALIDEGSHRCALVLEDVVAAGGTFGDPRRRDLDADEVAELLGRLAALHGRWWGGDPSTPIAGLDHGIRRDNRLGRYYATFDRAHLAGLLDGPRGAALPDGPWRPEALHDAFWANAGAAERDAPALIHADPHLGNIFVRADGRTGLADWQTLRWGRWAHDVSYLVGSTLPVPVRRAHEDDLLDHYLDVLRATAPGAPSGDAARLAYRQSLVYGLVGWLTAPDYFGYPEDYRRAYATRFAHAALDHGTLRALAA